MGYIRESLSDGEEVKAVFALHWLTRVPMVIWTILIVTLPLAIWEWLKLRCIEQGVTNKRVILKTGVISRQSEEMKLSSIETVEITQGILGRILGYGTVKITGRGVSDLVFRMIADPMEVKRTIEGIEPA